MKFQFHSDHFLIKTRLNLQYIKYQTKALLNVIQKSITYFYDNLLF